MTKSLLITVIALFFSSATTAQFTWTQKANFPLAGTTEARSFSIGNYGYLGGPMADLWRYDPVNDIWTQMANFIGGARSSPVAFSIGNKGYLGTGGALNDFYEYDPTSNSWTAKTNFGGIGREGALGISINDKGYIGTGGGYMNDWWEYDTTSNAWTQKANLGGPGRYHGGAFSINGLGYVCCGFNGSFFNDLWQYDPIANTWIAKASMPGSTRDRPVGLATAIKGYILTGWTGGASLNDAYEYDPVADSWIILPPMPTAGRYNACGFVIGNKLYLGTGQVGGTGNDWWELGPDCISQASVQSTSCPGICDGTAEITFPDPAAVQSYLWSNMAITASIQGLCAGSYTATVTDTANCVSVVVITVTESPSIPIVAAITEPTCYGDSDGVICAVTTANPVSFLWASGDTSMCLQNIIAGTYTVTVTDTSGCSGTAALILTQPGQLTLNINHTDASCSTCNNGSAAAQLNGGTLPASYQWSTGSTLAFISNLLPGIYTCCVTDANGCTTCDSVEINYATGLSEQNNLDILISPNPFNETIVVEIPSELTGTSTIQIFDAIGREMYFDFTVAENKYSINTENFNSGTYFIQVTGRNNWRAFKLVKQ